MFDIYDRVRELYLDDELSGGGDDVAPQGPETEPIVADAPEPVAESAPEPEPAAVEPEFFDAPDTVTQPLWAEPPTPMPQQPPPPPPYYHQPPASPPPYQQIPQQTQPQQAQFPPLPSPDLMDTNPGEFFNQMRAHYDAKVAQATQAVDPIAAQIQQMQQAQQKQAQDRVLRGVQAADHAVRTRAYGKEGVFNQDTVFRGNEELRNTVNGLVTRQLQNATLYARQTGDTSMLDKLQDEKFLRGIVAMAKVDLGLDRSSPPPVQVKGASLADTTGPGRQTRLTKEQQEAIKQAKAEFGIEITEEELLSAENDLSKPFS